MTTTRFPTIIGRRSFVALLAIVSICWAHNGENIPVPNSAAKVTDMRPPRWSWVHWWEANRQATLEPPQGSVGDPQVKERISAEAKQKLVQDLQDTLEQAAAGKAGGGKVWRGSAAAKVNVAEAQNAQIRSAALLALARIGSPEALDTIAEAARSDPDPNVRRTAILALGLLGTPEAQRLLAEDPEIRRGSLDVTTAGLGLLEKLDAKSADLLRRTVLSGDPNVGSLATWALNHRDDPETLALFEKLLRESTSPWLVSDAVLAMGHTGRPEAIPLLSELLLEGPGAQEIIVYRLLCARQAFIEARRQKYQQLQNDEIMRAIPGGPTPQEQQQQQSQQPRRGKGAVQSEGNNAGRIDNIVSGMERTYASELRGSAAMALGLIDDPRARRVLLRALALPDDPYSELYKTHALISLGKIGNAECLPTLLGFLWADGEYQKYVDSPLRGHAAVALGLYAQRKENDEPRPLDKATQRKLERQQRRTPASRPVEPADDDNPDEPARFSRALVALGQFLHSPRQPTEVRTACALALGLSQREEALEPLQKLEKLGRNTDEVLLGYSFMARGLLHDDTILEPVRKFLQRIGRRTDSKALLAQRAAILGLGLLDKPEAIPILEEAWNLNYYASREVILALSLSRSCEEAGKMLQDYLAKTEDPAEKAYISLCIGEFYAKTQPSPLERFLSDTNYNMRNVNLQPYQELANSFLLHYLMGAFGDQWQ